MHGLCEAGEWLRDLAKLGIIGVIPYGMIFCDR